MNLFSVLSMGKSRLHETSMSAMLAYLLNPNQDHGLGDKFLKSFFELTNKAFLYAKYLETDGYKFDIQLEVPYSKDNKRSDIDIQIKIFDNDWKEEQHRIIIENKIRVSAANPEQLKQYYEAVLTGDDDDGSQISSDKLSVIFLTPNIENIKLNSEFENLNTENKTRIFWTGPESIVSIIQSILESEAKADISPINEYTRHTIKAFIYFISQTLSYSLVNRVGIDIGEISQSISIMVNKEDYILILRDSGQIQMLNNQGEKVIAKSLLKKYIDEKKIPIEQNRHNTRYYGRKIIEYLGSEQNKFH